MQEIAILDIPDMKQDCGSCGFSIETPCNTCHAWCICNNPMSHLYKKKLHKREKVCKEWTPI